MTDAVNRAATAPPALIKPHQFPVPHLSMPWNGGPIPETLAAMPVEQAAIASREVLRLRGALADDRSVRFVSDTLEAVYQRLVTWRHGLATEERHFDELAPQPRLFLTPSSASEPDSYRTYGVRRSLTSERTRAQVASMAIDSIARARHEQVDGRTQKQESWLALRNVIVLSDNETVPSNLVVLGGSQTRSFAPSAQSWNPTPDHPFDPNFDRMSVVVPAPLETQHRLHRAAMAEFADILVDPGAVSVPERYAHGAYLLFHSPLYLRGSDDVIRAFLATVGHLLFAAPVVTPHDIAAQARVRPQTNMDGVTGFVSWFRAELPTVLQRRQRARRLGPPPRLSRAGTPPPRPARNSPSQAARATIRPPAAAPNESTSSSPAPSAAGGGMDPGTTAMLGQIMYVMSMAGPMTRALAAKPELTDHIDHDVDIVESWF